MKRRLILLPELGRDFKKIFASYDLQAPGRSGPRFGRAFNAMLEQLEAGLITHRRVHAEFHRVLLKPYPYTFYYRLEGGTCVGIALLYARLSPETIQQILLARGRHG
jgi:hypothetical protein